MTLFFNLKNLTNDGLEKAIWPFWISFLNHYASFDEDPLCHWFVNFIFNGPSLPRKNMKREKVRSWENEIKKLFITNSYSMSK